MNPLPQLLRARKAGLSLSALATLHLVSDEAWPMHALAVALEMSSAAFTGVVDSLEKKGLARREPHPHDRRIWRVAITPAGKELINTTPAPTTPAPTGPEAEFARALLSYYRKRTRDDGEDQPLDDETSNNIESAIYHAAEGDYETALQRLKP